MEGILLWPPKHSLMDSHSGAIDAEKKILGDGISLNLWCLFKIILFD
jgi:hypothetical protein